MSIYISSTKLSFSTSNKIYYYNITLENTTKILHNKGKRDFVKIEYGYFSWYLVILKIIVLES